MKTTIVPQRVTLFNFATQNTSGNKMCLLKTILIPTASYSITKGHPLPATTSLILSALIDYAYTPIIKEPSMAPLLSQFLDKMLLGSVVVSLASVKRIPGRTASTVFARDILLSCGSLLHRYLAFPHPIHWDQFFDVNHYTSFSIAPTYFGRLNSCMTTLLVVSVLLNWSFKPPVTRAFVSLLPKIMDFCSIFSFMEYFLPPTMAKQKRFGNQLWKGVNNILFENYWVMRATVYLLNQFQQISNTTNAQQPKPSLFDQTQDTTQFLIKTN